MLHTKQKGTVSELRLMAALIEAGFVVSTPVGDYSRYDAILDNGQGLLKVQFKTGRYRKGAITFNAASQDYHNPGNKRSYENDIDFFGVYCPELDECYLVPISEVGSQNLKSLRVDPSKNNQKSGVSVAADFKIGPIAQLVERPVVCGTVVGSNPSRIATSLPGTPGSQLLRWVPLERA